MAQLRRDHEKFKWADTVILVLGPEDAEAFAAYWDEHDLPFTGLPDPSGSVLKRYGQEIDLFKFGRMPAMVLVDRQGTARFVHYGKSMSDIPKNAEVLEAIRSIDRELEKSLG